MNDILHLISLFLTFPALLFCILVILCWLKSALSALMEEKSPSDWLIIGVVLGFTGFFVDNLYWSLWWTLNYFEFYDSFKDLLIECGICVNIIFRQIFVILAGYCHMRAFLEMRGQKLPVYLWMYSVLAGFVYSFFVYLAGKHNV